MNLPAAPRYSPARRALLESIIERTRGEPPPDVADIVRDELRIDLTTHYAGIPIRHPFGKASGQLSCTASQVEEDMRAGLAFIGVVYTINAACILSLSFLVERFVRGRDDFLMMTVAGLFWAAGLTILLGGFSVGALLVCTAVWTVGEIIASILVPNFIARHVAHEVKGRFMALNDIVRSFAGVVCPIGLGFIWAGRGVSTVLIVLLAMPVLGMIAYGLMFLLLPPRLPQLATE